VVVVPPEVVVVVAPLVLAFFVTTTDHLPQVSVILPFASPGALSFTNQ
jgi:hypothetical protein